MSDYPIKSGKRLLRELSSRGYIIGKKRKGKKGKGSHVFIYNPKDKIKSTVIMDTSVDLKIGTLNEIRKGLGLERDEFIEILQSC